ncbi:hypothetical protein EON67_11840 [archaeon]|nr:MAG: hypothetical protein EON67_11840 [archaeon]
MHTERCRLTASCGAAAAGAVPTPLATHVRCTCARTCPTPQAYEGGRAPRTHRLNSVLPRLVDLTVKDDVGEVGAPTSPTIACHSAAAGRGHKKGT